jgi:UDP-N-acetylmuramoyl-L-alanyl-D-glutamate--2,6-diaminopimelate ligase
MWQKLKNIYHLFIAIFANIWFGFPSRKLIVVGVTGTDGKTTTVSLIYHILKSAGVKASMISSVGAVINNKEYSLPFHVTTLPPFALQNFIKMATYGTKQKNGKRYLVLEVTSHALDQFRVFGTSFDVGVITNISNEHLDYHGNYEDYVRAKLKLLQMSKNAVVNKDDKSYKKIMPELKKITGKISRIVTYGETKTSDINLSNFNFKTKLLGDFNKYNVLAAATALKLLDLSDSKIKKGISTFEAPIGRQDIVFSGSFRVMIDFAHTPNSFKEILSSLRPVVSGKIIHIFGSAGQRDRSKWPQMGKISSKYSDIMIVTAEDPRSEKVENITEDILAGINDENYKTNNVYKSPDRQMAINMAIKLAKKNDVVLITGKAHEKSMNYGKGEVPWDDYKAVKKALSQ